MPLQPLALPGADILFDPHFLPLPEADTLLQKLTDTVAWQQRSISLFGQTHPQPRLTAWYGEPGAAYTYSGLRWEPQPWLPALAAMRLQLEAACETHFNSVLLNLYRDGHDSMGYHADDEPELGPTPTIASLSLGAMRRLRLRPQPTLQAAALGLDLTHGSLLLMRGDTQHNWQHAIPKTARPTGPRLNLTFRWVEQQ